MWLFWEGSLPFRSPDFPDENSTRSKTPSLKENLPTTKKKHRVQIEILNKRSCFQTCTFGYGLDCKIMVIFG